MAQVRAVHATAAAPGTPPDESRDLLHALDRLQAAVHLYDVHIRGISEADGDGSPAAYQSPESSSNPTAVKAASTSGHGVNGDHPQHRVLDRVAELHMLLPGLSDVSAMSQICTAVETALWKVSRLSSAPVSLHAPPRGLRSDPAPPLPCGATELALLLFEKHAQALGQQSSAYGPGPGHASALAGAERTEAARPDPRSTGGHRRRGLPPAEELKLQLLLACSLLRCTELVLHILMGTAPERLVTVATGTSPCTARDACRAFYTTWRSQRRNLFATLEQYISATQQPEAPSAVESALSQNSRVSPSAPPFFSTYLRSAASLFKAKSVYGDYAKYCATSAFSTPPVVVPSSPRLRNEKQAATHRSFLEALGVLLLDAPADSVRLKPASLLLVLELMRHVSGSGALAQMVGYGAIEPPAAGGAGCGAASMQSVVENQRVRLAADVFTGLLPRAGAAGGKRSAAVPLEAMQEAFTLMLAVCTQASNNTQPSWSLATGITATHPFVSFLPAHRLLPAPWGAVELADAAVVHQHAQGFWKSRHELIFQELRLAGQPQRHSHPGASIAAAGDRRGNHLAATLEREARHFIESLVLVGCILLPHRPLLQQYSCGWESLAALQRAKLIPILSTPYHVRASDRTGTGRGVTVSIAAWTVEVLVHRFLSLQTALGGFQAADVACDKAAASLSAAHATMKDAFQLLQRVIVEMLFHIPIDGGCDAAMGAATPQQQRYAQQPGVSPRQAVLSLLLTWALRESGSGATLHSPPVPGLHPSAPTADDLFNFVLQTYDRLDWQQPTVNTFVELLHLNGRAELLVEVLAAVGCGKHVRQGSEHRHGGLAARSSTSHGPHVYRTRTAILRLRKELQSGQLTADEPLTDNGKSEREEPPSETTRKQLDIHLQSWISHGTVPDILTIESLQRIVAACFRTGETAKAEAAISAILEGTVVAQELCDYIEGGASGGGDRPAPPAQSAPRSSPGVTIRYLADLLEWLGRGPAVAVGCQLSKASPSDRSTKGSASKEVGCDELEGDAVEDAVEAVRSRIRGVTAWVKRDALPQLHRMLAAGDQPLSSHGASTS